MSTGRQPEHQVRLPLKRGMWENTVGFLVRKILSDVTLGRESSGVITYADKQWRVSIKQVRANRWRFWSKA